MNRNIPAHLGEVDRLCQEVQNLLVTYKLEGEVFAVILMLREALTNAVQHGCKGNPTLSIEFEFYLESSQLVFTVRDPGEGFDWQGQRKQPCRIETESGRGLSILTRYSSNVIWNNIGNEITITRTFLKEYKLEGANDNEP